MNSFNDPLRPDRSRDPQAGEVPRRLPDHPFLAGLAPEHLQLLADNSMRLQFQPGELIFREGDPANRFYLIERGKVSLESRTRNGVATTVQVIGQGEVLGWSWLLPPYYWHFDARALELTSAVFLYGTRLREQCEDNHDFGFEMMKRMTRVMIQRLQAARKQLLAVRK